MRVVLTILMWGLVGCNVSSSSSDKTHLEPKLKSTEVKKLTPSIVTCDYKYTGRSYDGKKPFVVNKGFPINIIIDKKRNYTREVLVKENIVGGEKVCQIIQRTNYNNYVIEEVKLVCDRSYGDQRAAYHSGPLWWGIRCTRKADGVITRRKRVDGAAVAIVSYGYDVFQVKDNKKIHSYSASLENKKKGPDFVLNDDNGKTLFSMRNLGLEAEIYNGELSMDMIKRNDVRLKSKNGQRYSHTHMQYGERCDIDNDTLYTIKYNFKNYPDKNLKVVHFCNVKEREF